MLTDSSSLQYARYFLSFVVLKKPRHAHAGFAWLVQHSWSPKTMHGQRVSASTQPQQSRSLVEKLFSVHSLLVDDFDSSMILVWVHDSTVIDIHDRISPLASYRLECNATILS